MGRFRAVEFGLVETLVAFIVVMSGVMLFQLVLSRFDPARSLLLSLLICGVLGLIFLPRFVLPTNGRHIIAIALIGLIALMVRWSPFLHVEGGQDQGVYISMSAHFARTQGLAVTDQVRERLSDVDKAGYDKLNNRYDGKRIEAPGRSEGEHEPGIFIADLSRSAYVFQFYPLHPLWMALTARLFGDENRVYSLVGFSVLSVLMLSLLAYELSDRAPAAGFLAAGLLAINPIHVFLSRFPLTENVTVFFSATAFYYLLRYFKAREADGGSISNLVLSAGAWACIFFTHISGFLYAPLILVAILAGVVSATTFGRMLEWVGYGFAVFAAYALSLWYGMTWTFPYSYGTYRAAFGEELGTFFLNHWKGVLFVSALACCGVIFVTWHFRARIQTGWMRLRLDTVLMGALLVAAIGSLAYSTVDGYRLGFTADYSLQTDPRHPGSTAFTAAGENWSYLGSQLSNTGVAGFLHSSAAALVVYLSPFVFVFVLVTWIVKRRRMALYEIFLLMLVTEFLVIRTGMESLTLYYYYGRYLGAELVPYILVLAAVWLHRLFGESAWRGKLVAGGTLALAITWDGLALAQQYPGGEMHRVDSSMRPMLEQVGPNDIIVLAGGDYPALRTALDYYYGKHTVVVEPDQVATAIPRYSRLWAGVYVLSDRDNLADLAYLDELVFTEDTYAKGRYDDVLPGHSTAFERHYYLYKAAAPMRAPLRAGDTITFDQRGNTRNYLGAGWSHQEESGRWTDGRTASLILAFSDPSPPLALEFNVRAFNCVDVNVLVNGEFRTRWSFVDCETPSRQAIILNEEDLHSGIVSVSFEMPGVRSPHDIDAVLGDRRKLGIWVQRIAVDKANPGEGAPKVGRPSK